LCFFNSAWGNLFEIMAQAVPDLSCHVDVAIIMFFSLFFDQKFFVCFCSSRQDISALIT